MADATEIHQRVRASGISKVDLSMEELSSVIQTLLYDGRLEEVVPSVTYLSVSLVDWI
jgi:RNA polymerase Rpc34 subunit